MAYWGTLGGTGQKNSSIRNTFIPGTDLDSVHYFGNPLSMAMLERRPIVDRVASTIELSSVSSTVESLITKIVKTLAGNGSTELTQGSRVFFPNGVELIEIEVKASPVDLKVKIAGPKAGS
jgi:hypothetical protein